VHDSEDRKRGTPMERIEFRIAGEFIELHSLLKVTGVAPSGGAAKALIAAGGVTVDGGVELRKTCKIRADRIVCAGDARIRVLAADPAA
jgi:ribosome-associated protein